VGVAQIRAEKLKATEAELSELSLRRETILAGVAKTIGDLIGN
jgi:hypothetical protein